MSRYADVPWHAMSIEQVEQLLKTDRYRGMGAKQARKRRERVGENKLFMAVPTSLLQCVKMFFRDAMMLLLLLLCLIGCCFSLWSTVVFTLGILILYGMLTVLAYAKTCAIRETLSEHAAPRVMLIRGGRRMSAQARMLVPGDLICLQKGDVLPADVRLVSCHDCFSVRTLRKCRDGVLTFDAKTEKNAEVILAQNDTEVLDRENMAYAGAVVTGGHATALVVATGMDTYHGALSGMHALATQVGEPTCLSQICKYVRRYSFMLCAFLLPITIIGAFTVEGASLFDLLLLTLSLAVSSMSEQTILLARIVVACGVVRAASSERGNAAIIKNYAAIDKIGGMTDVFLVGTDALSDGTWHPAAAIADGKMYRDRPLDCTAVRRFYPYFYWYSQCRRGTAMTADSSVEHSDDALSVLLRSLDALGAQLPLDFEQLNIRIANMTLAPDGSGDALLTLKETDGAFSKHRVICTTQPSFPDRCIGYCGGEGREILLWKEADRSRIKAAVASLQNEGCRWLFCATMRDQGCVLEGAIAWRQTLTEEMSDAWEKLQSQGVRMTIVAEELTSADLALLRQSRMFSSTGEFVDGRKCSDEDIWRLYQKQTSRVMSGIDDAALITLMKKRQALGGICAVVALRDIDTAVVDAADVLASYDNSSFRVEYAGNAKPMPLTEQEREHELQTLGDDSLRRSADLLLRRTGRDGGAFAGLLCALRTCRTMQDHLGLMLQYLRITQLLRMTFFLLPLLFGHVMLSSPLLLLSGLWIDLCFALLLALRRGGKGKRGSSPWRLSLPVRSQKRMAAASVLTGVSVLLFSLLMKRWNVLATEEEQRLFIFLCLQAVQTTAFLLFCHRDTQDTRLPVLGAILFVLLPPVILTCIPPAAAYLGCATGRLTLLPIAWLSSLFFLLCNIACTKFADPLRRWLKKIFSSLLS